MTIADLVADARAATPSNAAEIVVLYYWDGVTDLVTDIDMLIMATVTPEITCPSNACTLQERMGAVNAAAFDMNAAPSLFWATVIGLIVGTLAQVLFLYVLSPSKSSHYSLADVASGREAEVIITIPAEGLGTIAFDTMSGRVTLGARSALGTAGVRPRKAAVDLLR